MRGGQKFLNLVSPPLTCHPVRGPCGAQGARKVGGSAPRIYKNSQTAKHENKSEQSAAMLEIDKKLKKELKKKT